VGPDLDFSGYWYSTIIIYGLIFLGIFIAMGMVCCKDYDPDDFKQKTMKHIKDEEVVE
jgi:hypothetical protein